MRYKQWFERQKIKPSDSRITHLISKVMQGQHLIPISQHRIRFLICQQLEQLFQSKLSKRTISNQFRLIPFGSDVSGFGMEDSDLDLCLVEDGGQHKVNTHRSVRILRSLSSTMESTIKINNRLHVKHFKQIQRIFRAFVPIIKCRSRLMPSLNVDVSVDTECNSGVQMAAYLHYCSHSCPSVRGLILLLKFWAKHHGM